MQFQEALDKDVTVYLVPVYLDSNKKLISLESEFHSIELSPATWLKLVEFVKKVKFS